MHSLAILGYLTRWFLVIITKQKKIFARKNNFFAAIVGLLCQFLKKSCFLSAMKWFYLKNKPG